MDDLKKLLKKLTVLAFKFMYGDVYKFGYTEETCKTPVDLPATATLVNYGVAVS